MNADFKITTELSFNTPDGQEQITDTVGIINNIQRRASQVYIDSRIFKTEALMQSGAEELQNRTESIEIPLAKKGVFAILKQHFAGQNITIEPLYIFEKIWNGYFVDYGERCFIFNEDFTALCLDNPALISTIKNNPDNFGYETAEDAFCLYFKTLTTQERNLLTNGGGIFQVKP